ncbi:MAG: hypothetical protein ACK4VZ_08125 [Paracoccaceae bacterium]
MELKLNGFRNMLAEEIGRGATNGVVDMERLRPATGAPSASTPENARAALGELPGIAVSSGADVRADLTADGDTCPNTADLEIGGEALSMDAAFELARVRASMLTEFDTPEPERVLNAVDMHLFFSFGAEARLILTSILPRERMDTTRMGLSFLVDGDPVPDNPFEGMQSCESAAALWALLAAPTDKPLSHVNGAAISRAFLSLPAHLRVLLGPDTAMRLLKAGDSANSEVVGQSFGRAAQPKDPTVKLLQSTQALKKGDPTAAESFLPTDATGQTALATLFTLVEARFQMRKPLEGRDIAALEAIAFEHGNGALRPQIDRAMSHGAALGGDFASAFVWAQDTPALEGDVWMLLSEIGAESQLLLFAVGTEPTRRASVPLATRSKIAERLLNAGLPNAASDWLSRDEADPTLASRIALAKGDARAALRLMAAQLPQADPTFMATAYTALGDYQTAALIQRQAGDIDGATRSQRWARNWTAFSTSSSDPGSDTLSDAWGTVAASLIKPDEQTASAPLQASMQRLEQSAATRQAIAALLSATPLLADNEQR